MVESHLSGADAAGDTLQTVYNDIIAQNKFDFISEKQNKSPSKWFFQRIFLSVSDERKILSTILSCWFHKSNWDCIRWFHDYAADFIRWK